MWPDLRLAYRTLRRSPMFTVVAVLSLGLGIGANTAMFSLMDQVLLRPLPVRDPSRLVVIHGEGSRPGMSNNDSDETVFSYPMYKDLRDRSPKLFDGLIARSSTAVNLAYGKESERAQAEIASGNYFDVLGVKTALGRTFTQEEDNVPDAHPVVVLTHSFWTRRFGANPAILNQTVLLNGHPMTVIGVTEAGFRGLLQSQTPDLILPIAMKRQVSPDWVGLTERSIRWLNIFGRLGPGVTREQATAGVSTIYKPILEEELVELKRGGDQKFRDRFLAQTVQVRAAPQGISEMSREGRDPLLAMMGMTALVLLIACANLANLLLARAASRQKEIAIRLALGASRMQVVRQLLVESVALALAGGMLGLLLSVWINSAILQLLPGDISGWLEARVDFRLLAFTLALSTVTGVIFGLVPALQASRPSLAPALKEQSAGSGTAVSQARLRRALAAAQVALSLLLLAGAGLFARSLHNLATYNPGFKAEGLLTFSVDPPLNGYSKERGFALYRQMQERLAAIPGVISVGSTKNGPLTHSTWNTNVTVEGYQPREDEETNVSINSVTPGYFQTMGIGLLAGREFTARDDENSSKVAVINQAFAKHYFGDRDPVGRHMGTGGPKTSKLDMEIVGVVATNKHLDLREKPMQFFYTPYPQAEKLERMDFYVRTARDPETLSAAVRRMMTDLDSSLPVYNMKTMPAVVGESIAPDRLLAILAAAFGFLATLMAALGLYGVLAYSVSRRTREIGVRMALGAERGQVVALVMREVGLLVGLGMALGLPLALGLGRLIESLLFGIKGYDGLVFTGAVASLLATALLAGYLPARRAASIDPITALRYE